MPMDDLHCWLTAPFFQRPSIGVVLLVHEWEYKCLESCFVEGCLKPPLNKHGDYIVTAVARGAQLYFRSYFLELCHQHVRGFPDLSKNMSEPK